MKKQFIWVTFQQEGIHQYPEAGTNPALADVSFLQYPHRHMFHVRVELEVFHDDRDLEFILIKRELQGLFTSGVVNFNNSSCEMISDNLHGYISAKYPGRECIIEVSEDGENGSRTIYTAE